MEQICAANTNLASGALMATRRECNFSSDNLSPSISSCERREFASEIKFLVSLAIADQIRDWARGRLAPDPHAGGATGDEYRITSLYFDTEAADVFHRRGSFGRSKYRVRRYGESGSVFLERKLKTRGLLAKRRSILSLDELDALAADRPAREWTGFWFHRRLLARGLSPVCQVSYDRTARVAMSANGPIRLTLDQNLQAIPVEGPRFCGETGPNLLDRQVVLELKFRREAPALFRSLVGEFALDQQPFSKYRLAAACLGLVAQPVSSTQDCGIQAYA